MYYLTIIFIKLGKHLESAIKLKKKKNREEKHCVIVCMLNCSVISNSL